MLASKLQKVESGLGFLPRRSQYENLLRIQLELAKEIEEFVREEGINCHLYNPTEYAGKVYEAYLRKYMDNEKQVLILGMNPGPHGMCQTGVPFGNVADVRDWMQLTGDVAQPRNGVLDSRPIKGFQYNTAEQSGKRVWTLFRDLFGSANDFFSICGVLNVCPIAFFEKDTGKNLTPEKFPKHSLKKFKSICVKHLLRVVAELKPRQIVCLGRFVETCLGTTTGLNVEIIYIPHPSPLARNNQNWVEDTKTLIRGHSSLRALVPERSVDSRAMQVAVDEARLAMGRNEVPVGCAFVDRRTSEVVCRAGNRVNETKNATRHAEMVALDEVLSRLRDQQMSVEQVKEFFGHIICYVTVEPCIMCLSALRELGVTESVFGCRNDRFGGTTLLWGREFQRSDRPPLLIRESSEPGAGEMAMNLLKKFYAGENPAAPVPKKRKEALGEQ